MNSPDSARRSVDETKNKSSSSSATSTNNNGTAAVSASHQMIMATAVFVVWKVDTKQPINWIFVLIVCNIVLSHLL